jgi:hypothetical protein
MSFDIKLIPYLLSQDIFPPISAPVFTNTKNNPTSKAIFHHIAVPRIHVSCPAAVRKAAEITECHIISAM